MRKTSGHGIQDSTSYTFAPWLQLLKIGPDYSTKATSKSDGYLVISNSYALALRFLKPGGWIELQDLSVPPRCDDGSAPSDSAMLEISSLFARAAGMVGLDMQAPSKFPQMLRDIGFEDIHTRRYKWPIGPWAKGSKEKLLGRWALQDCFDGMQGGTMAFFTRVLKMKPEEVEARLAEARKEMKGQKTHLYLPV